MSKQANKTHFYDIFRFGPEFEMEVPDRRTQDVPERTENETPLEERMRELHSYAYRNIETRFGSKLHFIPDGSLRSTEADTECIELIASSPFESQAEEDAFIETMQKVIPTFKSKSGEDIFAYYNTTASTHFHWSFKQLGDRLLYVYDTRRFEKFFFERYLQTFKSEKFLARINYEYCRAPQLKSAAGPDTKPKEILRDIREHSTMDFMNERAIVGRRRWLNPQSVDEGTGMEIRIFPFLQTYDGVKQTMKFMKDVLLDYYLLPETQVEINLLNVFTNYISQNDQSKIRRRIVSKIKNEWKQIAFDVITSSENPSGEARIRIGQLIQETNPKQEKAI